jgi:hypothetical protein
MKNNHYQSLISFSFQRCSKSSAFFPQKTRGLTGKQLCHSAWSAAFDAFGHYGDAESRDVPLLVVAVGSQEDALEDLQVPKNARCYPYLPQVGNLWGWGGWGVRKEAGLTFFFLIDFLGEILGIFF